MSDSSISGALNLSWMWPRFWLWISFACCLKNNGLLLAAQRRVAVKSCQWCDWASQRSHLILCLHSLCNMSKPTQVRMNDRGAILYLDRTAGSNGPNQKLFRTRCTSRCNILSQKNKVCVQRQRKAKGGLPTASSGPTSSLRDCMITKEAFKWPS